MLGDGGVVGAEELLNLDTCQTAVPAPLSQSRSGLRTSQRSGSDWQQEHSHDGSTISQIYSRTGGFYGKIGLITGYLLEIAHRKEM